MLTYNVNLTYGDGSTAATTDTIRVVLIDGTWYIATFQQTIQNFDWDAFFNPQRPQTWYNLLGYSAVGDFGDGLWPVQQSNYWGFIDGDYEVVIPLMFSHVLQPVYDGMKGIAGGMGFNNGIAIVGLNNAFGVIDVQGEFIVPLSRDYDIQGRVFTDNYIILGSHMFSYDGTILLDNIFQLSGFNENGLLAIIRCDERGSVCALFNPNGEIIFELDNYTAIWQPHYNGIRLATSPTDRFTDYWLPILQNPPGHWGWGVFRYFDAINMNGELFFDEPKPLRIDRITGDWRHTNRTLHDFEVLSLFSYSQNMTFAYNTSGEIIGYADGVWGYWSNGILVSDLREVSDGVVTDPFSQLRGTGGEIINLYSGTSYQFGYIHLINDMVAIVKDENQIFYGLFVKGELLYPLEYTSITQGWLTTGDFTLSRGPEQLTVRITAEGTVVENP
jgi:hypothetical protein